MCDDGSEMYTHTHARTDTPVRQSLNWWSGDDTATRFHCICDCDWHFGELEEMFCLRLFCMAYTSQITRQRLNDMKRTFTQREPWMKRFMSLAHALYEFDENKTGIYLPCLFFIYLYQFFCAEVVIILQALKTVSRDSRMNVWNGIIIIIWGC